MLVQNSQPIEKRVPPGTTELIDVHSIFLTIQGEGPFAGQRALFIRLAGCNLKCPNCDTDYTEDRRMMTVDEIQSKVHELTGATYNHLIVITGGEPLRQDLSLLLPRLRLNYRIQIETNGSLNTSYDLLKQVATVVCSPKTGKVNPSLQEHIQYYKYVLDADSIDPADGLPIKALDHPVSVKVARPPVDFDRSKIYVQPVDVDDIIENARHTQAAIDSCLKYGYTFCLQIHKHIGME